MYVVLLILAALAVNSASKLEPSAKPSEVVDGKTSHNENATTINDKVENSRSNETAQAPSWILTMNSGAAMRTFYVVAFVMSTVVIYFIIRAVRLRRRKSKSRKYGVITSTSALEMEPLEKGDDDDDEDTTLFDVHHHNKYGQK
ncbi:membrane protein FAM174A-like [Centruroides sculpturatus]|uniref:membrane protein FAM174A-like n=1 Tax=Centruroides sculpturatus TaxID=218467 RepID=UPI000C6CD227|nr:membrane protein FAM174A-like [Centruroides sculpturatus]